MIKGYGEIGDNWTKISEGRNTEQFQGKVAELIESDLGRKMVEHTQICSVCRNLQIALGEIILNHINEFDELKKHE